MRVVHKQLVAESIIHKKIASPKKKEVAAPITPVKRVIDDEHKVSEYEPPEENDDSSEKSQHSGEKIAPPKDFLLTSKFLRKGKNNNHADTDMKTENKI